MLQLKVEFGEIWFIFLNAYILDGQAYIMEGQSDSSQPYDFRLWMGDFGMVKIVNFQQSDIKRATHSTWNFRSSKCLTCPSVTPDIHTSFTMHYIAIMDNDKKSNNLRQVQWLGLSMWNYFSPSLSLLVQCTTLESIHNLKALCQQFVLRIQTHRKCHSKNLVFRATYDIRELYFIEIYI